MLLRLVCLSGASAFLSGYWDINSVLLNLTLSVRFWHKADTQLTNNSFQCWWVGGTSIGHTTLPMFKVLRKPTLTLFVKKHFLFWRKKFLEGKSVGVCFWLKADIHILHRLSLLRLWILQHCYNWTSYEIFMNICELVCQDLPYTYT